MTWLVALGAGWLLASVLLATLVGRVVRLREDRDPRPSVAATVPSGPGAWQSLERWPA